MAATKITLNDALVGSVISPAPNGFVTRLVMTKSQWPPFQIESHLPFPLPFGTWKSGRLVLRDGSGRRLINLSTQSGALVASHVLMASGQQFAYLGDLMLECCPLGQEWELSLSDVPVDALRAA